MYYRDRPPATLVTIAANTNDRNRVELFPDQNTYSPTPALVAGWFELKIWREPGPAKKKKKKNIGTIPARLVGGDFLHQGRLLGFGTNVRRTEKHASKK